MSGTASPRLSARKRLVTRRRFLAASAAAGLAVGAGALLARRRRTARRFVLISIDTVRPDHLGCYGYDLATSPRIDAFAEGCARFSNAFAASSFTGPSVTSLLTSRYPGATPSLLANGSPVAPLSVPTLAGMLAAAGYRTAAIVGNYILRETRGLTPGFAEYDAHFDAAEENREMPERRAESLTAAALRWLDAHAKEDFFLWLHYQDPHGPYLPPKEEGERFARAGAQPRMLEVLEDNTGYKGLPKYQKVGDERDLGLYLARYDGEIATVDRHVGLVFDAIERLGAGDTGVIVTSDHGEAFGERDYYCCHGQFVTPELTRVPLLVRMPGMAAGAFDGPVSLVDVAPTILEAAGVASPETFMGKSLHTTLAAGAREGLIIAETSHAVAAIEDDYLFTWGAPAFDLGKPENPKATTGREALESGPSALYDLSADPGASVDVSAKRPEWAKYLRARAGEYLNEAAAGYMAVETRPLDESELRALRSLGYTH
jgi:arylsulfatase